MSDNLNTRPDSHLLALPSEVRLLIYELVFPPRTVRLDATATDFRLEYHEYHLLALLATCRTIYAEAKPVFYDDAEFYVWLTWNRNCWSDKPWDAMSKDSLSEGLTSEGSLLGAMPSEGSPAEIPLAKGPSVSEIDDKSRWLIDQIRDLRVCVNPLEGDDSFTTPKTKRRWYRRLISQLTSLARAPHLKKLHIEIEMGYYAATSAEVEHTISLISRVTYRVEPTISIKFSPSSQSTNSERSVYLDMLAKLNSLNWVDATPEIYSTKLADLTNERLRILQKIQSGSTSMAIQSAEHLDMVNNDNFYVGDSVLQEQAQSALAEKPEIKMGLGQIVDWKNELEDLAGEIASTKKVVEWVIAARSSYAEAEAAVSDEALTVVN